jgi:chemosensory pili system protein ChpA (sensor histidine kinase/response regulator)
MTSSVDADLLEIFLLEAWDSIARIESVLDRLRAATSITLNDVAPLTIVSHRLKGAAALHGFQAVSILAGEIEQAVLALPAKRADDARGALAALTAMTTNLKAMFDGIAATGRENETVERVGASSPAGRDPVPAPGRDANGGALEAPTSVSARDIAAAFLRDHADIAVFFVPEAAEQVDTIASWLLAPDGGRPPDGAVCDLTTVFRAAHTLKGAAYTVGCTPVGDAAHEIEDRLAAVRDGRAQLTAATVQAMFELVDELRAMLGLGQRAIAAPAEPAVIRAVANAQVAPASATPPARSTIRVTLARLDRLMQLTGELVVARSRLDHRLLDFERLVGLLHADRARLTKTVGDFETKYLDPRISDEIAGAVTGPETDLPSVAESFDELEFDRYDDVNILARRMSELLADVTELESEFRVLLRTVREDTASIQRLVGEMRTAVASTRKVALGTLFARVARQVRETARTAGKLVDLDVQGETVEVDTAIIDAVADALLHLVQNAIAHGIEAGDVRRAGKKPECGTVRVHAATEGALVAISVEDDGAGLDLDAIRTAAIAQGRASATAVLSPTEIATLIFAPGLSTASTVTTASGRGVGLDVVHASIRRLNGEVTVESRPGRGTRFTLRIPVAVAISDSLTVRVGSEVLAVPLAAVKRVVHVRPYEIERDDGRERIHVDGAFADLLHLARALRLSTSPPSGAIPVLLLKGSPTIGVVVDALLGREETVIQPLGELLAGIGPFAGAAISADGRVVLVLDSLALTRMSSDTMTPATAEPEATVAPTSSIPRVLVVDDSLSVRKIVGMILERAGFDVVTAADGSEALALLMRTSVDVIVTDLEMPRVNGYELIEDVVSRPAARAVPVIVLTTRVGEHHMRLARDLGIEHYLAKPVDPDALVQLVRSVVSPMSEVT